jgi:hypothetical protein
VVIGANNSFRHSGEEVGMGCPYCHGKKCTGKCKKKGKKKDKKKSK